MIDTKRVEIIKTTKEVIITIRTQTIISLPLAFGTNLLVVLLRCIKDMNGNYIFNYQDISEIFGKSYRQWSNNIFQRWKSSGENLKLFLEDGRETSIEILNLVSEFVLLYPIRSILEQHREFVKAYPEHKNMCVNIFRNYISAVDCSKLITVLRKQLNAGKLNIKSSYFVKVLLSEGRKISSLQKSYISELFPKAPNLLPVLTGNDMDWNNRNIQKYTLVSFLYTYGVSQDKLAFLFGVSKTSIHKWIHKILNKELKYTILKMLTKWSGKICVDEKWIRVAGVWHYVLSAVDSATGVPLLSRRFTTCDTATWTLFFKEFKLYYGNPFLIVSDGSSSLSGGINIVFPRVRHQLCWFHKLKNLHKRIYQITDGEIRTRALGLANGIFHNKHVSSRKYSAIQLAGIDGMFAKYIAKSILGQWLKLTFCLTSNAAERYNRKLEKCFNCRYGIKNEKCADALINGLWFFDILANGKMHCENSNQFENVDFSKVLKANFENRQILHFSKQNDIKTIKNVA